MDTKLLTQFVDVARLGSFAEVARLHNCDPSQVSRAIATLEQQLGVRLFQRSTRSLALTEAGSRYLARVSPVLEELAFAENEAKAQNQAPSGVLRITASTAFGQVCLLPVLPEFYRRYPDIELELQLTDQNLDLLARNIDIALRLAPSFNSDLVGQKLFDTHYRVCASPSYIARKGVPKTPDELAQHRCITMTLASYRKQWLFVENSGVEKAVAIQSAMAASNALAVRDLTVQGVGPALMANWLVDEAIDKGDLVELLPSWKVTATDFNTGAWLLYPSRKYLPAKTRVMIDYLKQVLVQGTSNN